MNGIWINKNELLIPSIKFWSRSKKSATTAALLKSSAHDWSRTSTSVGHYPLKVARLPIPPRERYKKS